MKKEEFLGLVNEAFNKRIGLLKSKGEDYATDDDFNRNFKQVANCCVALGLPLSSTDVATVLIVVKLQRLMNLYGRSPQNESVEDTLLDLRNYVDLYEACLYDENGLRGTKQISP